jgi:hypothetical protein
MHEAKPRWDAKPKQKVKQKGSGSSAINPRCMNQESASKPLIPLSAVTKINRKGSSLRLNGSPAARRRSAS